MICGTCRHDNQPNAKFCSECGTPLARRCPACDTEQAPAAKFCDECGTPLTATPPPAPASASSPSASRKLVTALFADLVGSTSFAERVDPEAVRSSLAPYFALLQSTIDDHAGSVIKFLGDGMLALFGVPEVAEDDALRAVAAGVELQRRFRSFADEIRERHGVELDLRVGINTGELVIGGDDVDLVGDVLNTASRLEAACEPGRVLVGEDTWRLTRSNVAYEVLDEVRVKGKAGAVATFQVVEHDDGAVGPSDDVAVFVGRSEELDVLGGVFADAVATSSARLATVIGSPGVGKTRLARELRLGTETRSFDVRLERRGSTTFTPIADLLRAAAGSGSLDDVERLLVDHPERDRLAPVLASFLGHGDARSTEESFWAVRRLLELLAADGPLIVVVDDIQWAEPLFWDLLDHLVEWTAAPVLLLALARPELRELRPELTQPGRRVAASIALEGLDADTTLELAARLLGIDELPADLADRLPESTEGNPLFVRELVQMLVDDGVLARDGDRWRLTIDADAIEVPPTILSLLASRVERLPDDERQVVELASVIGTEFDRGTLEAIADADVAGRLGGVIDRLRRKDLIEPSGQWSGDHPVYRFHHVLIRDAAYRRLLKAHRAELHELVGRHVESSRVADDEVDIIVAHHFEQVFRYRSELGVLDDHTRALATTAATRLRSAAELALEREDLSSAGNAAIRALQLLDVDAGADRDELLLIGCEALLSTGDATKASPLVDELHGRSSDERLAAWADCFRGQMWSLTDAERLTEAAEVTADAAERLAAIGDDSGVAKARLVRASCLARLGRVGDCEAELDLALGAARAAGDRRRTVAVLGAAPLAALWGPSPVARAGGRCLDVLRLLRITSASPTVEATSIRCQGMLEALRGRFDSARSKLETSRATARELGLRHGLYETELFAGMVELFAGDAAAAEPHLRAARDGLGRLGIGADAGQASALLARSLLLQGRIAEADQLAADALETAGQNLQTAITAGAVLAEVRAAQGRHDDARRLVDDAISIASSTDVTLDHALSLFTAARVATTAGDSATSHRRAAQAAELLDAKGVDGVIGASRPLEATRDRVPSPVETKTADDEVSNPSGRRLWNGALDIAQRGVDCTLRNDRTALLAYLSSDFRGVHHGVLAADFAWPPYGSAEEFADFLLWLLDHSESRQFTIHPLAIRGDRLAMYRSTTGSDAGVIDRLVVARSDSSAMIETHFFDPNQLFDAIHELDRQWIEHDPSAVPRVAQLPSTRLGAALAAGDPDAIRSAVTDDFVALDHRQIGLGERHVDDWIESMAATTTGGAFVTIPANVLMGDEHHVLSLLAVSLGDDTWHVLTITEVRDGLVSCIEHFDGDDVDRATARYRELVGQDGPSRQFTNTAWELGLLADLAFRSRDDLTTLEFLAPDFVAEWHHDLATSDLEMPREVLVGTAAAVDRDDLVDRTTELLAIRGERLALVRATNVYTAAREVSYVLLESDAACLTHYDRFEEGRLAQGLDELDRRWLAGCGLPSDAFIVAVWPRANTLQAGDLSDIVHPDFEFTDHRSLRNDTDGVSFDEFVRRGWVEVDTWTLVTEVHRFDVSGTVYTRVERNGDDEICIVFVAEQADGALRRLDIFDPDDLDAALALFDGRNGGPRPPVRSGTTTNRAFRLADDFGRAVIDGDRDTMLSLVADDFEFDHRGSARAALGVGTPATRTEFVDLMLATAAQERPESLTRTLLASRGEDLYLAMSAMTTADGDEVMNYALGEADGNRLRRMTYFDESQLDDAVAEIDRRYRLACGIGDDHWLARNWSALTSPDAEVYEALLADDFRGIEHRPVRLGETDRNVLIAYVRATPPTTSWSIPVIHRLSARGIVFEQLETWGDGAGDTRVLMTIEFGDGVIKRLDAYEPDDLDAALTRHDEIFGVVRRTLTNGAWDSVRRRQRALDELDVDGYASMFDESFVAEFHDLLMSAIPGTAIFDKTGFLELILHQDMTHDGARSEMELIAVRGEDLCLYLVGMINVDGDLTQRLAVDETSAGLCTRMDIFESDQLAESTAAIDRRYRLSCGISDDHWIAAMQPTLYSPEFDVIRPALHPEFEWVERRGFLFPSGDATELGVSLSNLTVLPTVTIPAIHRLSEHGSVCERHERFEVDGLEPSDFHFVLVNEFEDGQVRRVVAYELDDLDRALAEFDASVRISATPRLTNAAWQVADEAMQALTAGDRHRLGSALADDLVVVAHTPVLGSINAGSTLDKAAFVQAMLDPTLSGLANRVDADLMAIRGDDRCLMRAIVTSPAGDLVERIYALEARDGLATRIESYPHDQLREAQVALDRRWLTTLGFDDEDWIFQHWDLAYSMAFDDLGGMLHPDFEFVDHRPLHFPSGDAATLAETMDSIGHEVDVLIPQIHRISRSGAVVERIERAVGDVLGEEHQILVTHIVDDAIRRTDSYSVNDLPAALARFEESMRPRVRQLTNAAWELAEATMVAKARDGDRERFESVLADDFVATSHDSVMGQIDGGVFGKHRFLEIAFDPATYAPTSTQDIELVAVRGDDRCLVRTTVTTAEGDQYERLNVVELRDGLCVRIDAFPHDQLGAAQIALDHAWLTSLGFADDHPFYELIELFYHSDPTALARAFSDEFRYVEHRRLSFPDGDRSQLLVNANTQLGALEVVIPRYLRLTERFALGERIEQTAGGAAQMPGLYLTALGADGRIEYMEVFDVDDEDAAIAGFDRLLAEERSGGSLLGPLTNAAWELVREAQLVKVNDGDRERFASFLADDFVAITHDSIMEQADDGIFDKTRWIGAAFDPAFGPTSSQEVELIAVRSDDRCLFRSRVTTAEGDLHERLNVLEVRDGLAANLDVFPHDQLGAALTTLDRRWVSSLGFADDHPWFAVLDWYYDSDATVMARELADDFLLVDHRRLTFPDGDLSQMITNMNTRLGAMEVIVPRYLRLTDRMALFEQIEQTVGGSEQSISLCVSKLAPDGRVAHLEIFEIDDEAAAIECFNRLEAPTPGEGTAPEHPIGVVAPLTNRASEIAHAFLEAFEHGDAGDVGHLFDPGGRVTYRNRLRTVETSSVQILVDFVLDSRAEVSTGRLDLETLAVRDEHLCLVDVDSWYDDANLRMMAVIETDGERVVHMVWFDDDQLIEAQLELDRRWLASTDQADHWFEPHWPLLYDPHPDAMFDFLAPDFEYIEHRPLMYPSGDAELMRTTIASMEHEAVFTIPRIHRMSDAGGVFERVETAVGEFGQTHVVFVTRFVDQLVRSIEAFDITQLDEALARYEEFTSD
jgi:class 3 adenylate cyclase/tetratricopeptide (TPR) repeat protein